MKIGIVTGHISKKPAGLERYNVELVKNLSLFQPNEEYLLYVKKGSDVNFLSPDIPKSLKIVEVSGGLFWKEMGLFFAPKADVYVFSGLQIPLLFTPKKFVVIVLDLWFKSLQPVSWRDKLTISLLNVTAKKAAQKAAALIAISQSAKEDFIRLFKPKSKTFVVYPGFNKICGLTPKTVTNLPDKFFLFVGTVKGRKNVFNIIQAFRSFYQNNKDYSLIIAGSFNQYSPYGSMLISYIKENNLADRVVFLGYIEDEELCYLYKKATAFVFPSVMEGFGFPVLEAMDCGVPVITSKSSSLGEIAEESAVVVDPSDVTQIEEAMSLVLVKREELIKRGLDRANQFSWKKMAEEFVTVLKSL